MLVKFSTSFLYRLLKQLQPVITNTQRGQAQPHLYASDLERIKIPLPKEAEQTIALNQLNAIEEQATRLSSEMEQLKNNRQSLTENAGGRLVRLYEITSKIGSGATPLRGERSYKKNSITLIRSQNVHDNQFVEKGLAFISDEQAKELDNVTLKEGDVLFNITGASVCCCCIVDTEFLPARVNQHVAIIRTNDMALPKYVQQVLISPKFKEESLNIANSATTRWAITKTQLEDYRIPLPMLEQQRAIIAQITQIEEQMCLLQEELDNIHKMKEAVLKKFL